MNAFPIIASALILAGVIVMLVYRFRRIRRIVRGAPQTDSGIVVLFLLGTVSVHFGLVSNMLQPGRN